MSQTNIYRHTSFFLRSYISFLFFFEINLRHHLYVKSKKQRNFFKKNYSVSKENDARKKNNVVDVNLILIVDYYLMQQIYINYFLYVYEKNNLIDRLILIQKHDEIER